MNQTPKRSHYETLDIAPGATEREITMAYRRICGFLSPDRLAVYNIRDPQEVAALKGEVDEAFWVLGDVTRRAEYDVFLTTAAARGTSHPRAPEQAADIKALESTPVPLAPAIPEPVALKSSLPSVVDGPFLKATREAKGFSLERISNVTKIGRHHLIAIESNDFMSLPAEIYVRGFVQQMAGVLGLDPGQTVKAFLNNFRGQRKRSPM